jgi:hypothetical protein
MQQINALESAAKTTLGVAAARSRAFPSNGRAMAPVVVGS